MTRLFTFFAAISNIIKLILKVNKPLMKFILYFLVSSKIIIQPKLRAMSFSMNILDAEYGDRWVRSPLWNGFRRALIQGPEFEHIPVEINLPLRNVFLLRIRSLNEIFEWFQNFAQIINDFVFFVANMMQSFHQSSFRQIITINYCF